MPEKRHIYLDWNATTPPHPAVLEQVRAASELAWANPASVHGPGRRARAFIEDAREAVAALAGFDARDVVLTSGGTEANNLALGLALSERDRSRDPAEAPARRTEDARRTKKARGAPYEVGAPPPETSTRGTDDASATPPKTDERGAKTGPSPAILVSRIEHPSIVRMAEELARRGVIVAWVEPLPSGVVPASGFAAALERLVDADVRLLVLQAVNHETGVVQPVPEVAALARARGAWLHVDAVQAVGKLSPSAWSGADLLSVAAHKIRGPKGVGALCTRPGLKVRPLLFGGAQERGLRPGTQDPAACAGFAEAARRAKASGPERYAEVRELRDRLEGLLVAMGGLVNGSEPRAPHVTNLSWPGWRGDELCAALDLEGVAISSGSACSAGTAEPSPVITAIAGRERAASAVRVSLGEETTAEEVARAVAAFERVVGRARR